MSKTDELKAAPKVWWHNGRRHSFAEKLADAIVHGIGLIVSIVFSMVLLSLAFGKTAPLEYPALIVYGGVFGDTVFCVHDI